MDSTDIIIAIWTLLIVLYFICAIYFFLLQKKAADEKDRRRVLLFAFILFLFMGLSRLFHIISYVNNDENITMYLSQVFLYSTIITIIYSFEKRIIHSTHFFFTILMLIVSILYFIFKTLYLLNQADTILKSLDNTTSLILSLIMAVSVFLLSFMYLKITFQSSGIVRRKSLFVFLGIVLLVFSYGVYLLNKILDDFLVSIISFTLSIISIPFLILGYK